MPKDLTDSPADRQNSLNHSVAVAKIPQATQLHGVLLEGCPLFQALEEVVESSAIGMWLTAPNAAFDGLKPLVVIDRGEIDRIWQMIYQLRSGVAF